MKKLFALLLSPVLFSLMVVSVDAQSQEESIHVLFLTKSSGYQHGVVKRKGEKLSHAGKVMKGIAEETNLNVKVTKDASMITEDLLKRIDVVQFYTSGNLFKKGSDGNPPMSKEQGRLLLKWIKSGGSFVGVHSATDTFKGWKEDGKKPYIDMIGGQFRGHSNSRKTGVLTIKEHPITSFLKKNWKLRDEFYIFSHPGENRTPLTILQTDTVNSGKMKNRDPYMLSWIKKYGKGRVFYTALGHRADVWTNDKFKRLVYNGILWANGVER